MKEKFGDFKFFDKYNHPEYKLKRDPALFKHYRADFEEIAPTQINFINDKHYDYKIPIPVSLHGQVDDQTIFKTKRKR